jgi:cob(I)alamin adenosyltransferase
VAFFQFLKWGKFPVSEEKPLKSVGGIKFVRFKERSPLFERQTDAAGLAQLLEKDLKLVRECVESGEYDMIILDEITHAVNFRLIEEKSVIDIIKAGSRGMDFILTGRDASAGLIRAADLVTEMKKVKHPFDKGVKAAKGIEF